MMRRVLGPALLVLGLLLTGSTLPALAVEGPDVGKQPTTCEDGLGVAHVKLFAADGSDTTFTTTVRKRTTGATVTDNDRLVPAGQNVVVDLPGLLKGRYDLDVRVDGHLVFGGGLDVTCTPTHPYKQAYWTGYSGCDRTSTYDLHNAPIEGSEDLLEKVHFKVFQEGGKTFFDGDLPDGDDDPYEEDVVISWDDAGVGNSSDQVLVTADGEPLDANGWAVSSCIPPEPPLPNTGS